MLTSHGEYFALMGNWDYKLPILAGMFAFDVYYIISRN